MSRLTVYQADAPGVPVFELGRARRCGGGAEAD